MPLIAILTVACLLILGYALMAVAAVHDDDIEDPPASVPDTVRRQQSHASERRRDEWLQTCFCRDSRRTDWVDEFYRVYGGE